MPRFIYTIFVSALVLWVGLTMMLLRIPPTSNLIIFFGLVILFVALALTFSMPIYYFKYKKAPLMSNLKKVYRQTLKLSVYLSFGVTTVLGLRAFGVLTYLNLVLFVISYSTIYLYFFKK